MTTTYNKSNPETIKAMFSSIAKQYDRTNAILSFNLHHYWNHQLINIVAEKQPTELLDLCSGTGEIAFGYHKKSAVPCQLTLLDFCPDMLSCARMKQPEEIATAEYVEGDAQELPFSDSSTGAITVAYGIRNVKEPLRCFKECFRVLKPGGRFAILELTRPQNSVLRFFHGIYLRTILPILGRLSTSNQQAYEYLCNSIHTFVEPDKLEKELVSCGFSSVRSVPLLGGVATVIVADKS